jgi:hypothetical protein
MARKSAPILDLSITDEVWEKAKQASSGGCLIADAIKRQYPHLTGIVVDMATIRASDSEKGLRYTWLTPPIGQHLLLSYDQGWSQPTDHVRTGRPVKVTPIIRNKTGPYSVAAQQEKRQARKAELEAKVERGEELTRAEKNSLTKVSKPLVVRERPSSRGPAEVTGRDRSTVVHGGHPLKQGAAHPNLLRGRDRHFGAKTAQPAQAFAEAVEAAVEERLASSNT